MDPAIDGETTLTTAYRGDHYGPFVEALAREDGNAVAGRDEKRLDATSDEDRIDATCDGPAAVGGRDDGGSGDPTDSGDGRTPGWNR